MTEIYDIILKEISQNIEKCGISMKKIRRAIHQYLYVNSEQWEYEYLINAIADFYYHHYNLDYEVVGYKVNQLDETPLWENRGIDGEGHTTAPQEAIDYRMNGGEGFLLSIHNHLKGECCLPTPTDFINMVNMNAKFMVVCGRNGITISKIDYSNEYYDGYIPIKFVENATYPINDNIQNSFKNKDVWKKLEKQYQNGDINKEELERKGTKELHKYLIKTIDEQVKSYNSAFYDEFVPIKVTFIPLDF